MLKALFWIAFFGIVFLGWLVHDASKPNAVPSLRDIEEEGGKVFVLPDGRWLEFFELGSRSDSSEPTVLYFHGAFTTGKGIVRFPPKQIRNHILAVTMPGFGASSPRSDNVSLHGYAEDVLALCRHLQLKEVVCVGGSWGGSLGLFSAVVLAQHHVRVRGVLIGAPALPPDDEGFPGYATFTTQMANGVLQRLVMPSAFGPLIVKRLYKPLFESDPEKVAAMFNEKSDALEVLELVQDLRRSVRWCNLGDHHLLLMGTRKSEFKWSAIANALQQVPIRVYHGEKDDAILPSVSAHLVAKLRANGHSNTKFFSWENGTHFSLMQLKDQPLEDLMKEI